jgi:hypothetical protein
MCDVIEVWAVAAKRNHVTLLLGEHGQETA